MGKCVQPFDPRARAVHGSAQVKELSETLAGMKGNLKRLEVMTRAWAAQPLFERGAKTSTAENFQQMQSVIITQRQEGHIELAPFVRA